MLVKGKQILWVSKAEYETQSLTISWTNGKWIGGSANVWFKECIQGGWLGSRWLQDFL